MIEHPPSWLTPEWPAPANVRALATTRIGGFSTGPFTGLNLAVHVDDDETTVARNRQWLREAAQLPSEPMWLQQVHGTHVWTGAAPATAPIADASVASVSGRVCAVLTADCLPVLLCDRAGTVVGAAHAGWRGLAGGVLNATIDAMQVDPSDVIAWFGPAIEQAAFEVGQEVFDQFTAREAAHTQCFQRNERGRWQADLYGLARGELARLGVRETYGGGFGTFGDAPRFYSYRREKRTGRMATLIWLS